MTNLFRQFVLLTLCTGFLGQAALAQVQAPAEKKVIELSRTSSSPITLTDTVTKNTFKDEKFNGPYDVQVPYQAEEEYTVEIPYQVQETYSEEVPYTVEVPYSEYVTDYRSEYVCEDVTRYREQCHNEVVCYTIPGSPTCREVEECGTNVHGEPICKTRTVCEGGSSEQRCEDKRVCENEPYTDRECSFQQVPYQRLETGTRSETRYRTETGTRTVTRYRTETRTRTVTLYRTETRCCKMQTRQVFDKQLSYQVAVHFPQDAALNAGEIEQLRVTVLSLEANAVRVEVKNLKTVYTYKIKSQSITGAAINIELDFDTMFNLNNAGPATVQNMTLVFVKKPHQKFQVTLKDTLLNPRLQTTYKLIVNDMSGVIEEQMLTRNAAGEITTLLNNVKDKKANIRATVRITRTSPLIEGGSLSFDVTALPKK